MKFICKISKLVISTSKCNEKLYRYFSNNNATNSKQKELLTNLGAMPKNTTHAVTLKKHRLKLKEKGHKYMSGTVNLQVLGSGANGSPKSLYMFSDQSRYMFNCGEGTQRLAHEHKMKLSKLEHIFVTHPTWDNIGGLPGVSLTIQDVGVPQITIHGPPGTDEIFIATRRFVVLRYLAIKMANCERDSVFEDNVMKVWYVPLCSAAAKRWLATPPADRSPARSPERVLNADDSTDDDVDYYAYWHNGSRSNSPTNGGATSPNRNKKRRHLSPEGKGGAREDLPPAGSVSMAYVCRLHDRPGTLSLPACVERGVPPGPLLGQLKAGEDVTLPNGNVVRSQDVTSPDEPGPVFVVVECPGEEFLDSLEEEEIFKRHQIGSKSDVDVAFLVVHFSPPHVMDNPRYRRWMGLFPASTHHLILNSSNRCMGSVAVHRIQHKLHMLCPELFPLLADQGIPTAAAQQARVVEENGVDDLPKTFAVVHGHTFTNVILRPQKLIDSSRKMVLEPEVWCAETLGEEGFPTALAELQARLEMVGADGGTDGGYPRVVFLGTGSCIPNKTRNTSGILLHISESSCMVLDCGEATYGQIVRLYGAARTADLMRGLCAVYVSHLHADHHIGLVGLLRARRAVTQRSLALLAPRQIRNWLNTYHSRFEPVLDNVTLVPNQQLVLNNVTADQSLLSGLLEGTGLAAVRTCVVRHCPNAFGVCLAHTDGWRIVYSGDTMPCDDLVQLGKDCDLLIHEATMEDKLEGEARLKMHSTTSQAIEVGRQMGARFTLLTHFSQRYAKVPIFNQSFSDNVGIAFDNMQVSLGDLAKLPLLYPALKLMFAEHYEEMELKTLKRQLQQEREMARLAT